MSFIDVLSRLSRAFRHFFLLGLGGKDNSGTHLALKPEFNINVLKPLNHSWVHLRVWHKCPDFVWRLHRKKHDPWLILTSNLCSRYSVTSEWLKQIWETGCTDLPTGYFLFDFPVISSCPPVMWQHSQMKMTCLSVVVLFDGKRNDEWLPVSADTSWAMLTRCRTENQRSCLQPPWRPSSCWKASDNFKNDFKKETMKKKQQKKNQQQQMHH